LDDDGSQYPPVGTSQRLADLLLICPEIAAQRSPEIAGKPHYGANPRWQPMMTGDKHRPAIAERLRSAQSTDE
jgi:hypothetical protein